MAAVGENEKSNIKNKRELFGSVLGDETRTEALGLTFESGTSKWGGRLTERERFSMLMCRGASLLIFDS